MRTIAHYFILAAALAGAAALDTPEPRNITGPLSKSFIVEYKSSSAKIQDSIQGQENIELVKEFDSSIFSGAVVKTDKHSLESLRSLPNVARVWANSQIELQPFDPQQHNDISAASEYFVHNSTGVGKAHGLGYFGGGAKVGVVDTGIWYNHTALGGCFGDGCKVAGGYDFVGNEYWPIGDLAPDDDPLDQLGHGTHVAGIIAGEKGDWTGVAPKATLYAYKVFSHYGVTTEEILITAFLKAYDDGVDIITSSVGGTSGWSTGAWAEVASRIVEQGVIVTISAGNSGAAGAFFGSNGASGKNVIAVASAVTELYPASPFEVTASINGINTTTKFGYIPSYYYISSEAKDWPFKIFNFNLTEPADACEPFPAGTPTLGNEIPLVRRGGCTFATKQANLEAIGARYILVYNNENELAIPSSSYSSTLGLISAGTGEYIIKTIESGGTVTADFSLDPEFPFGIEYKAGGHPSDFTSWGGTYDLQLKPDITGPGGQIFSTYLDGGYAVLSGTSMACPYIAGVAALYIGAFGGRDVHGTGFAKLLTQRIISSGIALPWYNPDIEAIAPVAQVGNGLIDAFKVLNYTTALEFQKIALNDTRYFSRYHDITVKNEGKDTVSYKFSVQPAARVEIAGDFYFGTNLDWRLASLADFVPIELVPVISLPQDFALKPGEQKTVSVHFDNPDKLDWNFENLPLYSGKIVVSSSLGEQLSVPYFGIGADLRNATSPLWRYAYPACISGYSPQVSIKLKNWYSFDLALSARDYPTMYVKIKWGTRQLRWDIFESGWQEHKWNWPLTPGENGYINSIASWSGSSGGTFNPDVNDPDDTFVYPIEDVFRNAWTQNSYHQYTWFGKLANGSQIEVGNYTMRFAALKPFGNPALSDNWEVFDSPEIAIRGKF